MDPNELPPMRTGLSQVAETPALDATKARLMAAATVMTMQAARVACIFCEHSARTEVTKEDLIGALQYQAMTFLGTLDDPEVVQDILEAEEAMFGEDQPEGQPEESEQMEESEQTDIPDAVLEGGECACVACKGVREARATWASWEPEDEAERYLKRSVERAMQAVDARLKAM